MHSRPSSPPPAPARGVRYRRVVYPWRALIGGGSPHPARFYAALIGQALRYGLPATRRFSRAATVAGQRGIPEGAVARVLRAGPGRAAPDLDALVAEVAVQWSDLAGRSRGLGPVAPPLTALALERRAARTIFLFGDTSRPLVVLKVATAGDRRIQVEVASLREADSASIAPRYLGRVADAEVQEGLAGRPLRVEPLTAQQAGDLRWPVEMEALAGGLACLAAATAKPVGAQGWSAPVDRAIADGPLRQPARTLLAAAARDVARLERSVLNHHDPSPQNCLCANGGLSGLVDWETACSRGLPGFDVWIAALSYLEHSLGLVRWSQEEVIEGFAAGWERSPYFREARTAIAVAADAAGVSEAQVEALMLVFSGVRLGHRLARPETWHTTAATAARTLELMAGI